MTISVPTHIVDASAKTSAEDTFVFPSVDSRIFYPSYVSFDEFIDVDRLRSLDGYIRERIVGRVNEHRDFRFYTGPYRLSSTVADRPGSRMIYLAESVLPDNYFDLDRTELWRPADAAEEFPELMDFIATLPFKRTGRMLILYDDVAREVPAHRDHVETEVLHDFIWMRTNLDKQFYMLNHSTGERRYIEGYSAWFDTVNQFHGGDAFAGISFSIRVDGVFTEEFRSRIPRPPFNAASTPSFWACTRDT